MLSVNAPSTRWGPRVVRPPTTPGVVRRIYAAFATTRLGRLVSRLVGWKLDPILLRLSGGRLATTLLFPAAVLETVGARTGARRRNAVMYFHDGDRITIVASHAGAARHPGWYHNLRADPRVLFGGVPMEARVVEDEAERDRLWGLADRTFPGYATYRRQAAATGRSIPIVQLTPR